MSLLKQDIIRKEWINKLNKLPKPEREFEAEDNKKYEFKVIINSVMYSQKVVNNQMLGLYYFVL